MREPCHGWRSRQQSASGVRAPFVVSIRRGNVASPRSHSVLLRAVPVCGYSSALLYAANSLEHDVEIGTGWCALHRKRADRCSSAPLFRAPSPAQRPGRGLQRRREWRPPTVGQIPTVGATSRVPDGRDSADFRAPLAAGSAITRAPTRTPSSQILSIAPQANKKTPDEQGFSWR